MRNPSFSSEPSVQYLSQVVDDISQGFLQIPRFQRPLIWEVDRQLELFRSIRDGIPIGSVMVWRTNKSPIECYPKIGRIPLTAPIDGAGSQYILDGVQRLSTLYNALYPWDSNANSELDTLMDEEIPEYGEEIQADRTYFDLKINDFVRKNSEIVPQHYLPLSILFNSVDVIRFQRALDGPDAERWINISDALIRSFREYKIPIIPITTDDIDLVTLTFQRINSQGKEMSQLHMLHALTWSSQFDLQREISQMKRELLAPVGWEDLDDDPILKCCRAVLGVDLYKGEVRELSKLLKSKSNTISEVGEALALTAHFLAEECGVSRPDLSPYALQIILISEALRINPILSGGVRKLLTSWFWFTTYTESFTGISDDRVRVALEDIREISNTGLPIWRLAKSSYAIRNRNSFDMRAARSKGMALLLGRRHREYLSGAPNLLETYGKSAVGQLFRASELRPMNRASSSAGNRILIAPSALRDFHERSLSGELTLDERLGNYIDDDLLELVTQRKFVEFVINRNNSLNEHERAFYSPHVATWLASDLI